jgi:hypothetical protein
MSLYENRTMKGGRVVQVVQRLPSKHEALSSSLHHKKKNTKEQNNETC